jgi:hypothetical protein
MNRLVKFFVYILCLLGIGLVLYTYLGPWFGADFSAPQGEIRVPVTLDAD